MPELRDLVRGRGSGVEAVKREEEREGQRHGHDPDGERAVAHRHDVRRGREPRPLEPVAGERHQREKGGHEQDGTGRPVHECRVDLRTLVEEIERFNARLEQQRWARKDPDHDERDRGGGEPAHAPREHSSQPDREEP